MSHRDRVLALEVVMERGRQVRPAPDVVRARLLARARTVVAAAAAKSPRPAMVVVRPATHERGIALAAAVTLAFAAAGAAAALHARAQRSPEVDPTVHRSPETPLVSRSAAQPPTEEPAPASAPSARPARLHRAVSPQESYAAELQLLQRAQSEYTSQDFPDALVLVAEHARRFPNGRMAEECEALRVRSLAGAGRGDEARRSLSAFAERFPHSALLPRLRQSVQTSEE